MRKFLFLVPVLALGACLSTPSLQNSLDAARTGYDAAFLTPAAHYRQLGYCATGTVATLAAPCADRAAVAKLQAQDAIVEQAFSSLQNQINSGNTAGANAAFASLQIAISTAEATATNLGVK